MADQRRSAPRAGGSRGRSGPGRRTSARRVADAGAAATAAAEKLQAVRPNPKLTGRAVVLVLVVAVLVLSFASSLQAYLQQRHSIDSLKATIAEREAAIDALQGEKERWGDPAYVEQQARARFGYVMPGETAYVALDSHGNRIEPQASLSEPDQVGEKAKTPWWSTIWSSVELAGNPPAEPTAPPATKIDGVAEESGQ